MTAVSLSTIRQRFATSINAIVGMSLSRNPYQLFGSNPNTVAHLRFAVGVMSTQTLDGDRQTESIGALSQSSIGVKFAYRMRPKDQLTSLDESFDKAESIAQNITNRSVTVHTNLQIRLKNIQSELSQSGEYNIISITWDIIHYVPLQ